MGTGFFMNSAVLRNLGHLDAKEYKEVLTILGRRFFIDVFGTREFEDFWTNSRRCADLVRIAMARDLKAQRDEVYSWRVDVKRRLGGFKVSFFK